MSVYDSHSYFYSIQKMYEFVIKVLRIIFSFIRENTNSVSGEDAVFSPPKYSLSHLVDFLYFWLYVSLVVE